MKTSQWIGGAIVGGLVTLTVMLVVGLMRPQPAIATPPLTIKWEYNVVDATSPSFMGREATKQLNTLGREGWEAFAVAPQAILLKRHKQ